jgi:aryl-alcohol dehydrogenase-like predicted oxidoreductase
VCGHADHQRAAAYDPFVQLADHYGVSAYCIMLAWLLSREEYIIPIPGARRIESAVDSARAKEVALDPDHAAFIDTFPDFD